MKFAHSLVLLWLGVLFTLVSAVPLSASAVSPHNSTRDMSEAIADIVRRFQEEIDDGLYERAHAELEASDLAKRQEGQHIEKRFFTAVVDGIKKGVEMIVKLVSWIKGKIAADKKAESDFTQQLVQKMFAENRCNNYVICHNCKSDLKGQKHRHEEFKLSLFHKTKGYDIHWGGAGTVKNHGDGGYLNWAYVGYQKSRKGGTVEFDNPPC